MTAPIRARTSDTQTPVTDPAHFRRTLGYFCTGVAVITTLDDTGPAGFACQSFSSLSLDPPLVLFCPAKGAHTWSIIERVGRCTINLLAEDQHELSAVFGRRGENKFARAAWSLSPGGTPILDGVLAWLDCEVVDVMNGGDHHIVIGHVTDMRSPGPDAPLLFYRGAYGRIHSSATHLPAPGPHIDDWF